MKKPVFLLLPALALNLTGCLSSQTLWTAIPQSEPLVCSQWLPISYAGQHDTAQTINDVRHANARRRAYCSR